MSVHAVLVWTAHLDVLCPAAPRAWLAEAFVELVGSYLVCGGVGRSLQG